MDDSIANLKYRSMRDDFLIYSQKVTERDKEISALKAENEKLREACRNAMNQLGVPQPEDPAPVTNAYRMLDDALRIDDEK